MAVEPDNVCVYVSRGNARFHLRDPRALADYVTAFRLDAHATAREGLRFLADDARRRPAEVLDNCDRHIRINDQDALAYFRRGITLLLLGRTDEADSDLARCRELLPGGGELFTGPWRYFQLVIDLAKVSRNAGRNAEVV
jgi:hypothetical protein